MAVAGTVPAERTPFVKLAGGGQFGCGMSGELICRDGGTTERKLAISSLTANVSDSRLFSGLA